MNMRDSFYYHTIHAESSLSHYSDAFYFYHEAGKCFNPIVALAGAALWLTNTLFHSSFMPA